MNEEIVEIVDLLAELLDDVPLKARVEIELVISMLGGELEQEDLIKVQEQLEVISTMGSIDSYTRSEILNILSDIETMK